jgi:hypothetical protein
MDEKHITSLQPLYLLKIFLGLLVAGGLVVIAFHPAVSRLSPLIRYMVIGGLISVSAALIPFVRRIYNNMDELQKVLHQKACVASLTVTAAVSAIIGTLQANNLMPLFNQFWMAAVVVGLWSINLMRADRRYK